MKATRILPLMTVLMLVMAVACAPAAPTEPPPAPTEAPPEPTEAPPGTREKIELMRRRVESGLPASRAGDAEGTAVLERAHQGLHRRSGANGRGSPRGRAAS